jgi:hypothetical protein
MDRRAHYRRNAYLCVWVPFSKSIPILFLFRVPFLHFGYSALGRQLIVYCDSANSFCGSTSTAGPLTEDTIITFNLGG